MTRTLRLERRMTHDASARLWDEIAAHVDGPLNLDCRDVKHLSGVALQVLLVAQQQCKRDGTPFKLTSASDGFAAGLRLLGADALLSEALA